MARYNYSNVYSMVHLAQGGALAFPKISYKNRKYLFFTIMLYQCLQLLFNIRIFTFEGQIKKGNNINHTTGKLLEYLIGFIMVHLIVQILEIFN